MARGERSAMSSLIDLTGQRFDRLLVLKRAENTRQHKPQWLCLCDCGQESVVAAHNLKSGNVRSCGCLKLESATTHGHARGGKLTPEYRTWRTMRRRCNSPNTRDFSKYKGRDCLRWKSFENFLVDILPEIGPRPPGKTLDRFPNRDGNYEPGNVRWATPKQQRRNQSRTKLDESKAQLIRERLSNDVRGRDIMKEFNVSKHVVHDIKRGKMWPPDEAA